MIFQQKMEPQEYLLRYDKINYFDTPFSLCRPIDNSEGPPRRDIDYHTVGRRYRENAIEDRLVAAALEGAVIAPELEDALLAKMISEAYRSAAEIMKKREEKKAGIAARKQRS